MTHPSDLYGFLWSTVGIPTIIIALVVAAWTWLRVYDRIQELGGLRAVFARRERPAVRDITDADLDAAAADLDAWEAEMYANLDAAMPDSWARAAGKANMGVPAPVPVPVKLWPQPQHARLTDYAVSAAAPQPLPPRNEVAVVERAPSPVNWWAYNATAADTRAAFLDRRPLHDEQAHAGSVLQSLSRPKEYIDAPVSPAPVGAHRLGSARGAQAQRARWDEATGAFPVVRQLEGAAA